MSNDLSNKDNESSAEGTTNNHSSTSANPEPLRSNEIVLTAACHPCYAEISKRHASFATWPHENLPPVDALVKAGFFYTGAQTIVTCFHCNEPLRNWGPNDNPIIEHARWFPHCAFAKQLCGDALHREIQEAKRARQERARANEASKKASSSVVTNINPTTNNRQLLIPDESTLSRFVAARLDLPSSPRLLDQNFKLSIIKRCWEDQLQLKQVDLASECDLYMACLILQKQIDQISGEKENIVVPRMTMEQIRDDHSMDDSSKFGAKKTQQSTSTKDPGVHSATDMSAAGFEYTGDGDTAWCRNCRLEVSNWTLDMNPFTIHSEKSPSCPFVRSRKISSPSNESSSASPETSSKRKILTSSEQENIVKRPKIATNQSKSVIDSLFLSELLPTIRQRTFSHWPLGTTPSSTQMMDAGFFYTNIADRVICLYCNLIYHRWTQADDPSEVHEKLSPDCAYVKTKLIRPSNSSIIIINENSVGFTSSNHSSTSANVRPVVPSGIAYAATQNAIYFELPKRVESFRTWPQENLPSIDDLAGAGFFYTGTETIVSCFYCNGALQNWGPNDNPMIEHARWFPYCEYAKQLCGEKLHRETQESKRAQQEHANAIKSGTSTDCGTMSNDNLSTNSRQLLIPDESTLSRLVAARLDLPISQCLLDQHFKLSIIKRGWEDQLRLKRVNFASEYDLFIACLIIQKQIEHIDGKSENIIIPSIKMKQIREQNARMREPTPNSTRPIPNTTDVEMTTSSQSLTNESTSSQSSVESTTTSAAPDQDQSAGTLSNPCVLCLTEEKRLACIPCGHLATCVPCAKSLRLCPICRREIEAFVRIYV